MTAVRGLIAGAVAFVLAFGIFALTGVTLLGWLIVIPSAVLIGLLVGTS